MPLWRVPTSSSSPSLAASSSVLLGVLLAAVVANAKVFLRPAIFTSSRSELLLPTPIEARSCPAPTNATTPSTHKNCRSRLPATLLHQAPHRQPHPPRYRFRAPPSTFGDDNTSIFRSPDVHLLEGSVDPLQLLLCTAFHQLPFVCEVVVIRLSVAAVVHI